jgi:AcrR family transcriptional regulator
VALIAAARTIFAQRGFDAASIRAITHAAGANLGAITYHYGTKEALYDAVLETIATPLLENLRAADHPDAAPIDAIEGVVRAFAAHLHSHPDIPGLIAHELLRQQPAPAPMRRVMQTVATLVAKHIHAGQRDGSIAAGDPVLFTFSIVSQPIYLSLVRSRLRDVLGLDTDAPEMHAQVVEHIVRFVRRGLATPEDPS